MRDDDPGAPLGEAARRAQRAYSAAADHYARPALSFWDRFGAETVSRLRPARGASVLDLCCGAGASALASARAIGPEGHVLGLDLAAPLLELARAKAAREGLSNVAFRSADATRTGLEPASFDAVVCVFGVFFAADMPGFVAEMWRLVRPGGTLALTTWGPGWCEPASTVFWDSVREVEPSLYRAFNPWDEITTPDALIALLVRAGITTGSAEALAAEHELERPGDFWDVALGSGLRGTVDALSAEQTETVRRRVIETLSARGVRTLRTDVVFARAPKD